MNLKSVTVKEDNISAASIKPTEDYMSLHLNGKEEALSDNDDASNLNENGIFTTKFIKIYHFGWFKLYTTFVLSQIQTWFQSRC